MEKNRSLSRLEKEGTKSSILNRFFFRRGRKNVKEALPRSCRGKKKGGSCQYGCSLLERKGKSLKKQRWEMCLRECRCRRSEKGESPNAKKGGERSGEAALTTKLRNERGEGRGSAFCQGRKKGGSAKGKGFPHDVVEVEKERTKQRMIINLI